MFLRGAFLGAREVHALSFRIKAKHIHDIPFALSQLRDVSVEIELVDVVVLVALGRHHKRVAIQEEGEVVVDVDVGVACFLEHLPSAEAVVGELALGEEQAQVVLMAVHGEHAQRRGIVGPLDPGDVVGVFGHGHGTTLVLRQVVDVNAHIAVFLSSLGVFEGVRVRVERAVNRHVEFPDVALVKLEVGQTRTVPVPKQPLVVAKFLFIHPVRGAVDDGVGHAIVGDLNFGARGEVGDEDVVLTHKRHFVSSRGELGEALLAKAEVGDWARVFVGLKVVHVEVRVERVAVKAFACGGEHHETFVAAEFVASKRLSSISKGPVGGQQGVHHAACLVRPLDDARADVVIVLLRGVVLAVGHGTDAPHVFRAKRSAGPNLLVAEVSVLSEAPLGMGDHGHHEGQAHSSFHKFHSQVKKVVCPSGYI